MEWAKAILDFMVSTWGPRVASVMLLALVVAALFVVRSVLKGAGSVKLGPIEINKSGHVEDKITTLQKALLDKDETITALTLQKEEELSVLRHDRDAALQAIQYYWQKPVTESDYIGFSVPRDAVFVFGDMWGADKVSDEGYQKLEDQWTDQTTFNIVNANITSPIISIIDSKARKLPIKLVCSSEQEKLLHYFKGSPNVTLEIR